MSHNCNIFGNLKNKRFVKFVFSVIIEPIINKGEPRFKFKSSFYIVFMIFFLNFPNLIK